MKLNTTLIKLKLTEKGWSPKDFAAYIDVSTKQAYGYLSGEVFPGNAIFSKICEKLEITRIEAVEKQKKPLTYNGVLKRFSDEYSTLQSRKYNPSTRDKALIKALTDSINESQ